MATPPPPSLLDIIAGSVGISPVGRPLPGLARTSAPSRLADPRSGPFVGYLVVLLIVAALDAALAAALHALTLAGLSVMDDQVLWGTTLGSMVPFGLAILAHRRIGNAVTIRTPREIWVGVTRRQSSRGLARGESIALDLAFFYALVAVALLWPSPWTHRITASAEHALTAQERRVIWPFDLAFALRSIALLLSAIRLVRAGFSSGNPVKTGDPLPPGP